MKIYTVHLNPQYVADAQLINVTLKEEEAVACLEAKSQGQFTRRDETPRTLWKEFGQRKSNLDGKSPFCLYSIPYTGEILEWEVTVGHDIAAPAERFVCNRCYGHGEYEKETYAGPELYRCGFCNGTGEVDAKGLEELQKLGWVNTRNPIRKVIM